MRSYGGEGRVGLMDLVSIRMDLIRVAIRIGQRRPLRLAGLVAVLLGDWRLVDGRGRHVSGRTRSAGVLDGHHVLVSGQVPNVSEKDQRKKEQTEPFKRPGKLAGSRPHP